MVSTKDTSSYLQKFNGKWKRDDQLDESKLMDLFEMNRLFRAANSALTQLDVGATTSNFSLKASYGIISVNESYAYDSEVRQNRRDARSGAQFGRATLDAQSESITLESRWTEPLEGNMTETFEVDENNRLVRKAKVTLLNTNKTWEGVYGGTILAFFVALLGLYLVQPSLTVHFSIFAIMAAMIALFSVFAMLMASLIVDILTALIDPRVRLG